MCSRFHRDPSAWQVGKPLIDSRWCRSEPAPADYFTIFVERAVMAPDISKVDPDRHLNLRAAAWNFRNEVLRRLFHGEQSLRSQRPAHPIFRKVRCRPRADEGFCGDVGGDSSDDEGYSDPCGMTLSPTWGGAVGVKSLPAGLRVGLGFGMQQK